MAIFSRPPQSQPSRPEPTARRGGDAPGLTIISVGTTIVGDLSSEGVVKIEGTVEGTIRAGTQLLVAPGALIRGDIVGREIIAAGEIRGAIHATERVEIQAGALVDGDIRTQRIHIADGGRVNGQITMDAGAGSEPGGAVDRISAPSTSTATA